MQGTQLRPFKVVAAIGPSERAELVLEHALDLTSRHERADLHLVTVIARGADEAAQLAAQARLEELALAELSTFYNVRPEGRRVYRHLRRGDAGEEIVELVYDVEADALVVGGGTSGGRHPHLGKVARHVGTHSPCLVVLVRLPDYGAHPLRDKQCPDCVAVRAESAGEHWFCHAHADRRALTRTPGADR